MWKINNMNFTMTSLVSLFFPLAVTVVMSISPYGLEQYKYLEKWGSFGTYSGNYSKVLELTDKALAIAPDDIYYMDTKAVSSGQFIAQLSIEKTVYNITEDQLPFTIPIGITVSGAKFPYSQVVTTNPTEGITVNIFGSSPISVTVTKPQTFAIILNVVDADNKQAFNTKIITVNVVPALPTEDKDPDGIAIPFRRTGLVVPLLNGSDNSNGQRYSVNHHFKNYMMIGYFKIGKDQDTLEMKTDGPNHGKVALRLTMHLD